MSLSSSSTSVDAPISGGTHFHASAKRKRTRRRRLHELQPSCSSTSSSHDQIKKNREEEEEEEENYLAYCLVLLSRDGRSPSMPAAMVDRHAVGETVYRCKTCNKAFASFQALGGHRTSHTKLKPADTAVTVAITPSTNHCDISTASSTAAASTKTHLCAICGSGFSSGQALGGHMRRHRATGSTVGSVGSYAELEEEKAGGMLLDLNAPPPQFATPTFTFSGEPPLQFSALVDCHY